MKATITIDLQNAQLGETVIATFDSLTPEQRIDLCKQVMLEWLRSPGEIEKEERERLAIAAYREKHSYGRRETDDEIRNSYNFPKFYEAQQTSRGLMIAEVREATSKFFKEIVTEMVRSDPEIAKLKESVEEEVRLTFPGLVKDAMVTFFRNNLASIAANIKC